MENNMDITLARLFVEAYENECSPFYRDVYRKKGFVPADGWKPGVQQWRLIPTIDKSDLAEYAYSKRAFRPLTELAWIYTSSGTSRRPVVVNLRNRIFDYWGPTQDARRIMFFRTSMMFTIYAKAGMAGVCGDLFDMPATARLATAFEIEAFEISISQLRVFTAPLKEVFDTARIKLILLGGERCTEDGYRFIEEQYPNALVMTQYATSETHGIHARSCEQLARLGKRYVHFRESSAFPELLKSDGSIIEDKNEEGELILTVLWEKNIFPVIRFRTGDLARRVAQICSCKEDTYELLGRTDFDRALIAGGQLKSEELERVLAPYRDRIHDDFELHLFQPNAVVQLPRLELRVRLRAGSIDAEQLAAIVAKEMRVGPQRTFFSGVEEGLYLPLVCKEISEKGPSSAKHRRIIIHE